MIAQVKVLSAATEREEQAIERDSASIGSSGAGCEEEEEQENRQDDAAAAAAAEEADRLRREVDAKAADSKAWILQYLQQQEEGDSDDEASIIQQ